MMSLEKRYQPSTKEPEFQALWEDLGVHEFVGEDNRQVYSIDTPPATVSGNLHLGHVYSYSQTDFMARFWRMNGYDVFYPMGFDDNGLPTERLVERTLGVESKSMPRAQFISRCLEVSEKYAEEYRALWQRIGLSIDWRHSYRTIDARSRKISQTSFLDLYRKNLVYRDLAPTIWCPECQTALAQADLEDRGREVEFFTIAFNLEGGGILPIATTRPELLPACVAIFIHPEDTSNQKFIGRTAGVPLLDYEVPVLADLEVEQTKGTGVVMCCTFGDATDIHWWRIHELPMKVIIDKSGRLSREAGDYADLAVDQARGRIVQDLGEQGLILDRQRIEQFVRVHERCDTPVEFLVTKQWFIRIMEFEEEFLEAGERIDWHPDYLQQRFEQWIENLNMDWLISRQRHYGVPFPVWYCRDCGEPLLASEDDLPVDPAQDHPRANCHCGSTAYSPEQDVMDTWATSSLTPQIAARWLSDPQLYRRVFPFSLRCQAHEIIRTWAFYTVVKSTHHLGELPWSDVAISGWGLAPTGSGKISKSRGGGPVAPQVMIERYSADAVRYWAASTGFGKDAIISEEKIKVGSRLVTKLWNVARFSEQFLREFSAPEAFHPLLPMDSWILERSRSAVETASKAFSEYDYVTAKNVTENHFWHDLADNYLELVKFRLYGDEKVGKESAQYSLYKTFLIILKLFAPFLPFVTDAIYTGIFAKDVLPRSIHQSRWPQCPEIEHDECIELFGQTTLQILTAVRRFKSENQLPLSTEIDRLQLKLEEREMVDFFKKSEVDLKSATRCKAIQYVDNFSRGSSLLLDDEQVKLGIEM